MTDTHQTKPPIDDYPPVTVVNGAGPGHAQPAAGISIKPPTTAPPHRHQLTGWGIAGRVILGLVIAALGVGLAVSLVMLHQQKTDTARLGHQLASMQQAGSATGATAGQLAGQVAMLKTEVHVLQVTPPQLPPVASQMGICVVTTTDNQTGQVASVLITSPGPGGCVNGQFIGVLPRS